MDDKSFLKLQCRSVETIKLQEKQSRKETEAATVSTLQL